MAKPFRSSLPKVISRANREISTIIEQDIAKESELLKSLVDQVLAANMEVKKKNNQRINDTRRKLQELDIEIDELNKSIDLVDRETVLEQLNEMIDAENKIFAARQEIRFFENEKVSEKLDQLNGIYDNLSSSVTGTKDMELSYKDTLRKSNDVLYEKTVAISNEVIRLMTELYKEKQTHAQKAIEETNQIKERIIALENQCEEYLSEHLDSIQTIKDSSSSIFTVVDDDVYISEKIELDHENTLINLSVKREEINKKFELKKAQIIASYKDYEAGVRAKQVAKNKQAIANEKNMMNEKEEQLKNIRLLIIDAEKKQNFAKVQKLMKEFEKVEKSNISKVSDMTDKLVVQETKKIKDKTIKQLLHLQLRNVQDLNKVDFNLKLEEIKYQEAKILYKIKSDHEALVGDMTTNKNLIQQIQTYYQERTRLMKEINQLKLELRIAELEIMKQNEFTDQSLEESFKTLLDDLKEVEHNRLITLQENISNHEVIKIEQQFNIAKTVHDLKLSKELSDIDKLILKTRNESLIKIEKMKEDANSEIIYQESLIKIAQKERELQLVKVHSLYENERSLAEEQVERINLGVQVNDAFVKSTLQNQLLFASQQIKCAESEFDIRVENINLTKEQELAYANKKIDYYRQKYEYEKSKLKKELDDKLEDLNFKLLLFTDKKENQSIQGQINTLQNRFQKMIDEIEANEQQDEEIKRYEKVIEAAELRSAQAIQEASALKEQTVSAFEALYDQTRAKFETIEETNQSPDTVGIMPLLNSGAVSSADERLQKAIKEAEELYEERILKPTEIIRQTKETLLATTNDEETEAFINSQKDLKKEKIQEHADYLEILTAEQVEALERINSEIERGKLIQEKELEMERENIFSAEQYREDRIIQTDYDQLVKKEQDYVTSVNKNYSNFVNAQLKSHVSALKETNQWIKSTIRPYKSYIRKASRGLNAEKRELNRKNKRALKKALSDAEGSFTVEL